MPRLPPDHRLIYDKVLLAVYLLADEGGATCSASIPIIARQAGVPVPTTRRYLNILGEGGVIEIRSRGSGLSRLYILLDHPDRLDTIVTVDGGLSDDGLKEIPPPAF